MSSVLVIGSPSVSPSDSLPGVTLVVAWMAASMSRSPAPWWCVTSRNPRPGFPDQRPGVALFCRMSRTTWLFTSGRASSSSATAPATCGEAIDVPLFSP